MPDFPDSRLSQLVDEYRAGVSSCNMCLSNCCCWLSCGTGSAVSRGGLVHYLISTAGNPNYGDELIAKSWLGYLAQHHPDQDVWLDCPHPGNAAALLQSVNPRAHFTNTVWRVCWDAPENTDSAGFKAHIQHRIKHLGSPLYDAGLMVFLAAESIHLLGGGYVNTIWPRHLGLIHAMTAAKQHTGARIYATGAGFLPVADRAVLFAELAEFDHVTVRDQESSRVLGATLGLDDAFLGAEPEIERGLQRESPAGLVICLQSDLVDEENFEIGLQIARKAIDWARAQDKKICYVEAIPGKDRRAFDRLSEKLSSAEIMPFIDVWQNGLPLAQDQLWITSRFHFHFMAAAAGARGVVVEMKKGYYDVKQRSLLELGTGWAVNELPDSLLKPTAPSSFAVELDHRSADKLREAEAIYPTVQAADPVVSEPNGWWKRFSRRDRSG